MRFLSHLDVQRLLQRGLRRADIPVAYSQGFNPHPLLAFASALPVGYTSEGEWADIRLSEDMEPEQLVRRMNGALPDGFRLGQAMAAPETLPTLTALTASARYRVILNADAPVTLAGLREAADALLSGPIVVNKRTKGGMRDVDIRPQVIEVTAAEGPALLIHGVLNADGSLSVELFMRALVDCMGISGTWRVHRTGLYFSDAFPLLPRMERG